jgi:hypothetical protein
MAEYSNVELQTVAVGENVLFENGSRCCRKGYVIHRDDSGIFQLRGAVNGCKATYEVSFGANIAVPEGGTPGPVSLALTYDGETLQNAVAIETLAAAEAFSNIFVATSIDVPCNCCITVTVRNIGTAPVDVQNANIIIKRIA